MRLPNVPVITPIETPLPDALLGELEKSVWAFENQFPLFMRGMLRSEGWLDKYRTEISRLARAAYETGWNARAERQRDFDAATDQEIQLSLTNYRAMEERVKKAEAEVARILNDVDILAVLKRRMDRAAAGEDVQCFEAALSKLAITDAISMPAPLPPCVHVGPTSGLTYASARERMNPQAANDLPEERQTHNEGTTDVK